jgi:hypothetical protein
MVSAPPFCFSCNSYVAPAAHSDLPHPAGRLGELPIFILYLQLIVLFLSLSMILAWSMLGLSQMDNVAWNRTSERINDQHIQHRIAAYVVAALPGVAR